MNKSIKKAIRVRDKLKIESVAEPNETTMTNFKKARNNVKKLIREAKKKFFDDKVASCNSSSNLFQAFQEFCCPDKTATSSSSVDVDEFNSFLLILVKP